jgi:hypothetical protein
VALLTYTRGQVRIHSLESLPCRVKDETGKIAVQRGGQGSSVSSMSSRCYHAMIDNCKEIRLCLPPPGIARVLKILTVGMIIILTNPTALLSRHRIPSTEVSSIVSHYTCHTTMLDDIMASVLRISLFLLSSPLRICFLGIQPEDPCAKTRGPPGSEESFS